MQNGKRMVGTGVLLGLILLAYWLRLEGNEANRGASPSAELSLNTDSGHERKQSQGNFADDRGTVRTKLTAESRELLRSALKKTQDLRVAKDKGEGYASTDRTHEDPVEIDTIAKVAETAPSISLHNKTGSDTDWDKAQIAILNQLLGECYELANAQDPGLYGTIGFRFTLRAEPEIGGLVEGVELLSDYSTIEHSAMRECMQESFYSLELEPPEEGVEIARQITLRFDEE